jgi:acyl-[acyl-carrier-protein]-phospholipid O-acyltransferase/long-chain-fatty-acid--[acyl-carrier-protein] ligase
VKLQIGGDEDTVTAYLVVFSVAVGVGSALAALIARGHIVLRTTLAGAILLGLFALDLAVAIRDLAPMSGAHGPGDVLSSLVGGWVALDMAGLAIAGGLYIVPVFAAVQAWSGAAYRARTIAAVNVLNAAFMTGATIVVAILQSLGVTLSMLFAGLGVLSLLVATAIWKTMPRG